MKKIYFLLSLLLTIPAFSQLLPESFEGAWPPPGWGIYDNGIGTTKTWGQALTGPTMQTCDGMKSAFLERENVEAGVPEDWLISPQFIVPVNGQISFCSRLTQAGDQGSIYQVRIYTGASQSALGSYSILQQWTELEINPVQTENRTVVVDIPEAFAPAGSMAYVAFVMLGDNADRWSIDNVQVSSTCSAPTNVAVTNITATTATVSWTETGDATVWEVNVVPLTGPILLDMTYGIIATSSPFVITNLVPGITYQVCVRALCGGNQFLPTPCSTPVIFGSTPGIEGTIVYDSNGDSACDATLQLPGIPVQAYVNNVLLTTAYTNSLGEFYMYGLPAGTTAVTLQPVPPAGFPAVAPVTATLNPAGPTLQPVTICLPQPQVVNDLAIEMVPITVAQPGFLAYYKILVENNGSLPVSGATISLTYDSTRMTFGTATIAPTATPGTLSFALPLLNPYSSSEINLNFNIMQPPVNIGGEVLTYNAAIAQLQPDSDPGNDTYTLSQTIVNSYDPNDITVHQGATILPSQTSDYLTYTIRFQNTGTAEAVNIRLENTLEPTLDWSTFRPIASSHSYAATRNGDLVIFKFNNINLPASSANEPASHGYVTYEVKPAATVTLGSVINNLANIYFDFNPPIITNTATTTVEEAMGTGAFAGSTVKIYPNPVNDRLAIQTSGEIVTHAAVYDLNGRLCINKENTNALDTSSLAPGMYLAKITTDKGTSTFRVVKN